MTDVQDYREPYGESTVAISLYNYLAVAGHGIAPGGELALFELTRRRHHGALTDELAWRAWDALIDRGLVVTRDGRLDVVDEQRRLIVARDRSDAYVDDEGVVWGGWSGWRLAELSDRTVPIEMILDGYETEVSTDDV